MSAIVGLGTVAGADQVEPGKPAVLAGIGVGLLFDGEPAGAEPLGPQPQPPAQLQAAADIAEGGLDELEVLGVAEPARELAGDRLAAGPLPQALRQQGAEPGVGGERAAELGEVLISQALKEAPAAVAAAWSVGAVVMDPLYGSAAGSESGNYPMFLSGSGVAAIPSRPCRMANRAASVRVFTPSLA